MAALLKQVSSCMAQKVPGCLVVPNLHIKIINILIKVIYKLIRSFAYQSRLLAYSFWGSEKGQ